MSLTTPIPAEVAVAARPPLSMVVGPTRAAPSVLERLSQPAPALTDPGFLDMTGQALAQHRLLTGGSDCTVVVAPGTGTAGLESVAWSVLDPARPVLALVSGIWGERWVQICRRAGLSVSTVTARPGEGPEPKQLAAMLTDDDFQAVLVTQVDSSTGVRVDVSALGPGVAAAGALLVVDGIAALGAETVEQDAWHVDVYISGPSKGLAAPAGLFMVSLGPRAVRTLEQRTWTPPSFSLDLVPWLPVMQAAEAGRFGYFQSPAGSLLAALHEAQRLALAEGRPERVARHYRLSRTLHDGLEQLGLSLMAEPAYRANGISVVVLPDSLPAGKLLSEVGERGVVLQSGTYPGWTERTLRIGHLGTVDDEDIALTLAALRGAIVGG